MKSFLYKAKNCTDLTDIEYAKSELTKMIRQAENQGKPTKQLYNMLGAVVKKQKTFKHEAI